MGVYHLRGRKDTLLSPIAGAAYRHGLTPNIVTAIGLCAGLACGALLAMDEILMAISFGLAMRLWPSTDMESRAPLVC